MVRKSKEKDYESILNLWNLCFNDDSAFNEWYFLNQYNYKNTLVYEKNEQIFAMLQELPYEIKNIGKCTYIYGACTHPKYRKKGIMSELLNFSFNSDIKNGYKASVLIPQEKCLFHFYSKYGYKINFYLKNDIIQKQEYFKHNYIFRECNETDIYKINLLYEEILKCTNYIVRNFDYWKTLINMFYNLDGNIYCLEYNNNIVSYAFLWKNNFLWAQEVMSIEDEQTYIICNEIMKLYKKDSIKIALISKKENENVFGCIKQYSPYDNKFAYNDYYMNLMFN